MIMKNASMNERGHVCRSSLPRLRTFRRACESLACGPRTFLPAFVSTLLIWMIAASSHGAGVFYVSPDGKDSWSGRRASPGFFRKDGPFLTIPRALEAARAQKGPASIIIGEGTYFLGEPLVLRPEDSGLTISGPGIISGGTRITGWVATNLNGHNVLAARVQDRVFQELWVNGRRAMRARQPNTGYFAVSSVPDNTTGWQEGQSRFGFKEGEIGSWRDLDPAAKVVVMNRWVESHLPIAEIDSAKRLIGFNKRSVWQLAVDDPYYVEGVAEALDVPGEWYLDSRNRTVYYWPLGGEKADKLEAIAPVLEQVLRLEGDPGKGRFVQNVAIRGLTFSHTEWVYPLPAAGEGKGGAKLEPGGAVQAAFTVPASVQAVGARGVVFEDCRFVHLGAYAIELGVGCRDNRVSRCELTDLAGGGIKIGTPGMPSAANLTENNEVAQCRIHDGGRVFHSAVGIWVGQSPNNRFLRNAIYDFYYTGISIGWTWGYGPALATNNLVAFNLVHHIGKRADGDGPILSDMGGIYTLGMQPGTRILNNVWHDVAGLRYGGWGIYFDEGSSSIVAASNIVFRTTHGGFHQHYGATNTVMNNIFAIARDHQLQRSRSEPHVSFFFKTNVVVIDKGVFLGGNWLEGKLESESNVFFDTRAGGQTNAAFAGRTLDCWQALGHDKLSIYADPRFKNPDADDFTLQDDSPAFRLGFMPIDIKAIGPGSKQRRIRGAGFQPAVSPASSRQAAR